MPNTSPTSNPKTVHQALQKLYSTTPMSAHSASGGMTLPRGKRCTNEESFCTSPDKHDKFCRTCGGELEEVVEDLYITISTQWEPDPEPEYMLNGTYIDDHPASDEPKLDPKRYDQRITLKNLVRLIRECEKEMFIDEI